MYLFLFIVSFIFSIGFSAIDDIVLRAPPSPHLQSSFLEQQYEPLKLENLVVEFPHIEQSLFDKVSNMLHMCLFISVVIIIINSYRET